MPRLSFDVFTDACRRPRAIIWTGAVLFGLIALVVLALGVTSTYWFCANGCHEVQDDTIAAYNASSHAKVSCMACHMPVGSDPVSFALHKAEALGELYLTVTNQFGLPLNAHSEVALEMRPRQCTQCHSPNRAFTPSPGIIIDHAVHADNRVTCTTCHNRVAHPENFELALEGNAKHDDFMEMTACFRCHTQAGEGPPGTCAACHPEDFELKPPSHLQPGFYDKGRDSAGHARLALESRESSEASAAAPAEEGEAEQDRLAPVSEIDYCGTCHAGSFCTDCHGVPMPHPASFTEGHGGAGKATPQVCANCHAKGTGASAADAEFCNSCHHKGSDPSKTWIDQHFEVVRASGAQPCFECHESVYCAECHISGL